MLSDEHVEDAHPGAGQSTGGTDGVDIALLSVENREKRERVSNRVLLAMTIALAGCQFGWAIQVGWSTSTFLQWGLEPKWVPLIWLAGPISGLIVQPLVGAWSDRCTDSRRCGRRKPFIAAGLALVIASLLMFGNAAFLGTKVGRDFPGCQQAGSETDIIRPGYCSSTLVVAVIAFWILDFAINAIQGPVRTLLNDVIPMSQQTHGNAWFAFMCSLGIVIGSTVGTANWVDVTSSSHSQIQILSFVGSITVFALIAPNLLIAPVRPMKQENGTHEPLTEGNGVISVLMSIPRGLCSMDLSTRNAFLVNTCSYFAWFSLFMYATTWLGQEVMGGDPITNVYVFQRGVRLGNTAMALQAAIAMGVSFQIKGVWPGVLQSTIKRFGIHATYFSAQIIQGACLLATWIAQRCKSPSASVFIIVILGWPWACGATIPWAITGRALQRSRSPDVHHATILALFNLSQCLPEIATAVVGYVILHSASSASLGGTPATFILMMGGLVAWLGALLVHVLEVGKVDDSEILIST